MLMSQSLANLAPALALAQGEFEDASKTSSNPAFRSKYADLAEVLQTVRPVLSKHGLSIVQTPGFYNPTDKTVQVTTMLLHKSGEFLMDTLHMLVTKGDAQGIGSGLTYARRYAAAAICGIAQADDDGNGAVGRDKAGDDKPAKSKATKAATEPDTAAVDDLVGALQAATTDEQITALAARYAKLAPTDQARVLPFVKAAKARVAKG